MLTALVLTLASHVSAASSTHGIHLMRVELLTPEQIEDAPVDRLTRVQLRSEDMRLTDNLPSLVAPIVLISVGGGLGVVFGIFTWLLIDAGNHASGWDGLGDVLLAILTGIITVAGIVLGIVGCAFLPPKIIQRDNWRRRQELVRARMDAIEQGTVQEPAPTSAEDSPQAQAQLIALEAKKPGLGLPIGLMSGGAAGLLVGAYTWADRTAFTLGNGTSPYILPIACIVLGLAAEGFGVWQLISRIQQRAEIDAEILDLEQNPGAPPPPPPESPFAPPAPPPPPPPGAQYQLPPLPVQFAMAFRF